jgi:hypothetical protein
VNVCLPRQTLTTPAAQLWRLEEPEFLKPLQEIGFGTGWTGSWPPTQNVISGEVVTAVETFELTTAGGATDFARLIHACELFGPYGLIGGLAVNCYVEPVHALDADVVVITGSLPRLPEYLQGHGFHTEEQAFGEPAGTGDQTSDSVYNARKRSTIPRTFPGG